MKYIIELSEEDYIMHSHDEWNIPLGLVDALQKATPIPEGATNKDMFKTVFGYKPAADAVVCNKEEWCGASKPCNYCISNPNNIGREEEWWNAPYKAESEDEGMRIEHNFEYDAFYTEIADEFCAHDSEYQAEAINIIGLQFKIWEHDKKRTATHIQLLEIAEQLDEKGKWFIETLCDYIKGNAESEG